MGSQPTVSRWRRVTFKVLAVIYALFWLNVAFSAGSTAATRLHELAFRTFFAVVLVILPTVLQLRRPERKVAAQQQVVLAATAHMIGTFIAMYVDPVAYVLVAFAVILGLLHPERRNVFAPVVRPRLAPIASAMVVTVPLAVFVLIHVPDADQSRWEDTLVFAIALIFSLLVAATGTVGARTPAWTSAIALAGFGVTSALDPHASGSWGRGWGIAAVIGAVLVVASTESASRSARRPIVRT